MFLFLKPFFLPQIHDNNSLLVMLLQHYLIFYGLMRMDCGANVLFSCIVLQVCNCFDWTRSQWCYFTRLIHSGKPRRMINGFKYGSTSPVALRKALLQYGFQGNDHETDSCLFGNEINGGSQVQIFIGFWINGYFLCHWEHTNLKTVVSGLSVLLKTSYRSTLLILFARISLLLSLTVPNE